MGEFSEAVGFNISDIDYVAKEERRTENAERNLLKKPDESSKEETEEIKVYSNEDLLEAKKKNNSSIELLNSLKEIGEDVSEAEKITTQRNLWLKEEMIKRGLIPKDQENNQK
jgi:hypothetical protein